MMTVPLILSLSCFSLHLSQRVTTIYDMACFFWGGEAVFSTQTKPLGRLLLRLQSIPWTTLASTYWLQLNGRWPLIYPPLTEGPAMCRAMSHPLLFQSRDVL